MLVRRIIVGIKKNYRKHTNLLAIELNLTRREWKRKEKVAQNKTKSRRRVLVDASAPSTYTELD